MKALIFLFTGMLLLSVSCSHHHEGQTDDFYDHHEMDGQHENHEDPVVYYAGYNNSYEIFLKSTPLVHGEESEVQIHVTKLSDFKPLTSGGISIRIEYENDKQAEVESETDIREGRGHLHLQPEMAGTGRLLLTIKDDTGTSEIVIAGVNIFENHDEAHHLLEVNHADKVNTTSFTKEQSWKIEFASSMPDIHPFGEVIKAAARVRPGVGNETVIVARAAGIVQFLSSNVLEGKEITAGERLFTISGNNLADNNLAVRFAEAKNNYDKAQADYERIKTLAEDQIVSQKNLLEAANEYENARTIFNNLRNNFNENGQSIVSPMNGYVKQIFVSNGTYAEAGQPIISVAGGNRLILTADIAQKYAPMLSTINSANIKDILSGDTYTLDELNGKIVSYSKSAYENSFMLPVHIEINNNGSFYPGTLVEVFLNALSSDSSMVVPNEALMEEHGEFFVWVQINPELFEKRIVRIGVTDGLQTEITDGLKADERIVTRGAVMIKLARAAGTLDVHAGHFH